MNLHPSHRTITGDPHSEEGRANRRTFVGASEVAGVLGESSYAGPYSVWSSKVFDADEDRRLVFDIGHALEPVAIEWAAIEGHVKRPVRGLPTVLHPTLRHLGANLDAAELDDAGRIVTVIEAKAWTRDDVFDIEHLDFEPETLPPGKVWSAYLQMQTQMACTGARRAVLAALCDKQLRVATVQRDDATIAYIEHTTAQFWRFVERRTPPPASERDLDALRRTPRNERASVHDPTAADVFAEYLAAREVASAAKTRQDRAAATLRQRLGECAILTAPGYQATRSSNDRLTVKETR
jgi:predicted phage-related endonuclease